MLLCLMPAFYCTLHFFFLACEQIGDKHQSKLDFFRFRIQFIFAWWQIKKMKRNQSKSISLATKKKKIRKLVWFANMFYCLHILTGLSDSNGNLNYKIFMHNVTYGSSITIIIIVIHWINWFS